MPFHRYTTPAYNLLGGAFPGVIGGQTYDLVNVTSGGVGGGDGSANAAGPKAAPHVNAGTYFVAFGENATSSFTNRGMRALAENTDALDNIIRGSIPRPTEVTATLGGVGSYTLTGVEAWCGEAGVTAASNLFEIVGTSGEQLYGSTGAKLHIYAADDGSGGPVLGTGYVTGVRVLLSDAYTGDVVVRFLARTSLARLQEAPELKRDACLLMQAATDATYGASFYLHGLNDAYRRGVSIEQPAGLTQADTAGNGATIRRDGQALRVFAPWSYNNDPGSPYPDAFLSGYVADYSREISPEADTYRAYDGNIGFLNLYPNRTTWSGLPVQNEPGEPQSRGRFAAGFMSAFPLNVDADTLTDGGDVWTRLKIGTPGSTTGAILTVTAPYFVGDPLTGYRAIANGVDLVEVTFSALDKRVYIVDVVDVASNSISLKTLAGEVAALPTQACTFTLWQVTYQSGGNGGFKQCAPRRVNLSVPVAESTQNSYFMAPEATGVGTIANFGHFDRATGDFSSTLVVYPNGDIYSTSGYIQSTFIPRAGYVDVSGATATVALNPNAAMDGVVAGCSHVQAHVSLFSGPTTITISAETPTMIGEECEIVVSNSNNSTILLVWGANFLFSDASDASYGPLNGSTSMVRWRGRAYVSLDTSLKYLMERVGDYT